MNRNLLYLVLFLILAFTALYFYHRSSSTPSLQIQQVAVNDLNNKHFDWSTIKGKKTLVCFGASWCGECRKELQGLMKLCTNELKELHIIVISDEPLEKIVAYKEKYNYPFLFLRSEVSFSELGIYSVPANYLLNEAGKVVKEKTGDFAWEDVSTREHLLTLMHN
jgi:peroxiredoxin